MAQDRNFTWEQGSDLFIKLIYKEGENAKTALPLDLSSGYSVRMDIVVPNGSGGKDRLYTFNSADLEDADSGEAVTPDVIREATLSSGLNKTPNITIKVPRGITLPGGPLHARMTSGTARTNLFQFDIFLRNDFTDTQTKILEGTITVEESNTLWA